MAWKKIECLAVFIALLILYFIAAEEEVGSEEEEEFVVELTGDNFDEATANDNYFVIFFSPQCHCQHLLSLWEQLAEMMIDVSPDPEVIIAKVDCTEQQELCDKHKITVQPTLRFFKLDEKESVKFKGTPIMSAIVGFINEQLNDGNEILHGDDEKDAAPIIIKGKLAELTDENFAKHVAGGNHFVNFYAPWCGHCQLLSPVWEQLAHTLQNEENVNIAQIDCTLYRPICKDFKVVGYPTLLWIEDGKRIEEYSRARGHDDLHAYVEKMLSGNNSQEVSTELKVLKLTGDDFAKTIADGVTFVQFYAPWCDICKKLSNVWDQLAIKFHGSGRGIKIAKVDCTSTKNEKLCTDQQIEHYPTLFAYKNGERQSECEDSKSLPEIVKYISKFMGRDEL